MSYKSTIEFIKKLEEENELIRISTYVNPDLEITEIVDRISKQKGGGKALLFENTGTNFPILINSLGSLKRIKLALNVDDLDDIGKELENIFKELSEPKKNIFEKLRLLPKLGKISSWMPKQLSGKGKCQEVINTDVDISKIPILKCWPYDGGKFITLPIVNTKDPITGIRNAGMYRIQIYDKNLTGMHWHKHKVGARHFDEYKKLGKLMPVAISIGGDPVNTYAATAPLPDNIDEYMLSGFLRKKKVELVKCITQDIEVPADADFIIEGYVDPNEELKLEGPFGDHTGYYSLADYYPQFHITCITHRKDAVYPATIVGVPPQEDAYIAKATERIFLVPIKMTMLPEIADMDIPVAGTAHNLTIVKIDKRFAGHAPKVMSSLWGAGQMMFNKILIIADKSVDIHNYTELAQAISNNVDPLMDIHYSRGALDVLDHSSSKFAYGSKMCIDATIKYEEEKRDYIYNTVFENIDIRIIKTKFPEIEDINIDLLKKNISLIFVSIKKNKENHIKIIANDFANQKELENIKFVLFVDYNVNIFDIELSTWIFTNNIEPKRDCYIIESKKNKAISHILIDGTRKTHKMENFKRDWPNVVVSDEKTINKIDSIWNDLNLGNFIKSPSLKFKKLLFEGSEIAR